MHGRFVLLLPACLLAAFLVMPAIRTQSEDKPSEKPVFTGPPAPAELQVLASLVGEWKTEVTIKPSLRHPEGYTAEGKFSWQWIHNGQFLKGESFSNSTRGRFEATEIIGYNRATKSYRAFFFNSDGIASEATGEWNSTTRTMTWKAANIPAGWSVQSGITLGDQQFDSSGKARNEKGQTVRDASLRATRN